MKIKGTTHFDRFVESLDAPVTSQEQLDDLDLRALRKLKGLERKRAEELLVTRLEGIPDERVVRALALLGTSTAKKAVRDAHERYQGGDEISSMAAMAALNALIGWGEVEDSVGSLLAALKTGQPRARGLAAHYLSHHKDDPRVLDGLMKALDDPDDMTRFWVAEAVMKVSGLESYAAIAGTRIWLIMHWLREPYPNIRMAAMDDLKAAVADLMAGTLSPRLTDMPEKSPTFQAYLASLRCPYGQEPWAKDLNLEALCSLQGDERGWAELALVSTLDLGDPRRPRALAAMGSTRAIEPLEAYLPRASGEMKAAIEHAIKELKKNQAPN